MPASRIMCAFTAPSSGAWLSIAVLVSSKITVLITISPIVITGQQRVKSIKLQPEVVDPADLDMLQDLLVAAVNEAIERSQAYAAEKLQGLTGGLGIPGF